MYNSKALSAMLVTILFIVNPLHIHAAEPSLTDAAVDTYIYAYPLVTMEMTRRVMTNIDRPNELRAPMGQFAHNKKFITAGFKDITAPNADTLYVFGWTNVDKEPYIIDVPAINNHYFLLQILSGWTDVIGSFGSRTNDCHAARYAITGPSWHGTLPPKIREIKSPTSLAWIIARIYCDATPADYQAVNALQDQFKLTPMSHVDEECYVPPVETVDCSIDMKTPVRTQVNNLGGKKFFSLFAKLLKKNPPAPADNDIVATMRRIGIIPGKNLKLNKLDPAVVVALERATPIAINKIVDYWKEIGSIRNGWRYYLNLGKYGINYMLRAHIAFTGLAANLPEDAIYPCTKVDSNRIPLNGSHRYLLHFDKESLPPVNAFWSITLYDNNFFFVANPINRYNIGQRDSLQYNPDGSLDIYIQHDSPGAEKESNWLPAPLPHEEMCLMMRLYGPKQAIIDGSWKPPAVVKID